MTLRRIRITCWTPKATNTHSECALLIVLSLQLWLHERFSMLRYSTLPGLLQFTNTKQALVQVLPVPQAKNFPLLRCTGANLSFSIIVSRYPSFLTHDVAFRKLKYFYRVGFEIVWAVAVKNVVFWDVS